MSTCLGTAQHSGKGHVWICVERSGMLLLQARCTRPDLQLAEAEVQVLERLLAVPFALHVFKCGLGQGRGLVSRHFPVHSLAVLTRPVCRGSCCDFTKCVFCEQ